MDKTFDAASVEPRIYDAWEEAGCFRAGAGADPGADPYCIVIPPPNVTGSLHMGHAVDNTLQDVLIRYHRMRGFDVLWQPGTDHAGIATQMVVERQMTERGEPGRRDIGREAFLEKVWAWKDESGSTIINQLKRLGASCDWSRERFTMDEGLSRAVTRVFVRLHEEGLIYKDLRLVNWDPKLLTAISDLEVEQAEVAGHLWHFRYPLEDGSGHITVATTRPETMLGDTAVAVHPEDERYRDWVGRHVVLPLVGRRIPIVADEYADPEAGSGAVKITPAHDFNDFDVGRRHDLPVINVMARDATMALDHEEFASGIERSDEVAATVAALHGVDRFIAREQVVAMMDERGLLAKVDDHGHTVPHGDRSGVPIEPYLTEQWYVDAPKLAVPATASVREGRTRFVPTNWERTYFDWMENIQPWCVSRQLWWGHRIPAWYGPDGEVFVAEDEARAAEKAVVHYGQEHPLVRDEDVLDTWFSSALWPFSTLGWPDETEELERYYPTDVLVTGFDIIFFWVARMMMMGLHFMDEEPFHTVYIHPLVRDERGQKMSKSKGNVVDPLETIDAYGADALRMTLTALTTQGRDIKLKVERVAGYRNFGTKLWNATRFCQMNDAVSAPDVALADLSEPANRWIMTEAADTLSRLEATLAAYRFNDAADVVYRFVWDRFCDWYVELAKLLLNGDDAAAAAETRATSATVLRAIFKMLHPFMPFITEELWQVTGGEGMLAVAPWPTLKETDEEAAREVAWLVELIGEVRSARSETGVPAGAKAELVLVGASEVERRRVERHRAAIGRLARIGQITEADAPPTASAQIVLGSMIACLPLGGLVDVSAERDRLEKQIGKLEGELTRLDKKLSNEGFVAKAPPEVVEGEREKLAAYRDERGKLLAALERLREAA